MMMRRCLAAAVVGLGLAAQGAIAADDVRKVARHPGFKLTFAHRDLVWVGDPASPVARAYLKPDARPIATDFCSTKTVERFLPKQRRYFREARIAADGVVYAFTRDCERPIGRIDGEGRFVANDFFDERRDSLPSWPADASALAYDPEQGLLYQEIEVAGPSVEESLDFLPLAVAADDGQAAGGDFSIGYEPSPAGEAGQGRLAKATLWLKSAGEPILLATAEVPPVLRRDSLRLGSFDNATGEYLTETAYRPGRAPSAAAGVTVELPGAWGESIDADGEALVVGGSDAAPKRVAAPAIAIDGSFEDWRNIDGIDDPRGDVAPYLDYVPDVDLLEFKVTHDERHLYLYARVAGQVGRSHPRGGRSYFYAYLDVDRDATTGFLPTRDDDCYFGVDLGDDCEVQFEFVNNRFQKTFYGFCGLGGDEEVLRGVVALGPSHYSRVDGQRRPRKHYKSEYTFRGGTTEITEDLKAGTSDTIRLAISPNGSEVEIASTFDGFLRDAAGRPILAPGRSIDLAGGMECDSKAYPGKTRWGADSTRVIRGLKLEN